MTVASPPPPALRVLAIVGDIVHAGAGARLVAQVPRLATRRIALSTLLPRRGWLADALADAGAQVSVSAFDQDPDWRTVRFAASLVESAGVGVLYALGTYGSLLGAIVSALTGRRCLAGVEQGSLNMLELEAHRLHDDMHVAAGCEATALHAFALGVRRDRLHRVPAGAAIEDGTGRSGELHRLLGLAPNVSIVGWCGRFAEDERPAYFVRAAAHCARERDDVAFAMMGDGPLRERMRELATAVGLADRLTIVPARRDAASLLASLACLVLAPADPGVPGAALDAMAAGVPIVATATGALPEVVRHAKSGIVADDDCDVLASAVADLLADPASRSRMALQAHEDARTLHSMDASCDRLADVLTRLARERVHG